MKKKAIVILIIVIFVAIAIGAIIVKNSNKNNGVQDGMQKIKMSEVTRSVFYAPQYVAINNGYFKDCGIEIELTTGQGADDNFNWSDLKGKTVIPGRKGGVPYMTLEYVIKQKGLNPKTDLKLDDSIKFDLMASAFTSGTADYVTLFEPTASNIQKLGKGYIVASVGKEAGEIPYTAYFAKKSYIQNNEKMIQEFTNAIYKGQKWVKEHTAKEIAEAIQSFFPDTDLELLTTAVQSYKDIDAWNETPVLKEESFNKLQDVISEAGELKQKAPYDKIVNNNYAYNACK